MKKNAKVLNTGVANQRNADQKFVGVWMPPKIGAAFNDYLKTPGANKSQFVRDAILEKLKSLGYDLPPDASAAPSRIGVGGPKPKGPSSTADRQEGVREAKAAAKRKMKERLKEKAGS